MRSIRLAAALLSCAVFLSAQTNRGGITGTIFDPTGAVVPGAKVTITNVGTNAAITVTSSGAGSYVVPNLDPVVYNVSVEASGFNKQVVENVKVDTAQVASVDVKLQTGTAATSVTVDASVAMVNTESGTTGSTVTEREIQDTPLFNRSVLDLAVLQPNVAGDAGTENPAITSNATVPGYNLSVNGGRPGSTQFLADGVNNTGVSYGRTMVSFTPETVQEFTIQTNAYSAEYGTAGGGIINSTTKSGTNRLSGTALWYNRNPAFAAAPFTLATTNRPKPTQKDNTGSLTAGGPLWIPKVYNGKNKTFWFAAYEPHWRRDMLAQDALQPTEGMLRGDFSNLVNGPSGTIPLDVAQKYLRPNQYTPVTIYQQYSLVNGNQFVQLPAPAAGTTYTPYPNNIIPQSMIDQSFLKAVKYIPQGTGWYVGTNGAPYNLFSPRLLSIDDTRYTLKLDHNISDFHHLSGRFTTTPVVKTQFAPSDPTGVGGEYSYAKQAMLDHTWIVSPTIVNDFRLNYTRGKFSSTAAPEWDPYNGGTRNLNAELGLPYLLSAGLPSLPYIGGQGSTNNNDVEERYDISDTVNITRGTMNWKIGFDVNRAIQNVVPLYGSYGGVYDFGRTFQTNTNGTSNGTGGNAFAGFVLGVPFAATFRTTMIPYYYRWNAGSGFVQNDWKVKPNLTLNLGIRYSLQMPRTEKYDHQGVFRPDLAQSMPLANPITLTNGEVIKSVLVPPFAFAGKGGRSRYLYPADYTNFEPRFGFAYSPAFLKDRHVTLRGGYGLSHLPVTGFVRLPAPDFSGTADIVTQSANPQYVTRLGENPPVLTAVTPDQAIFGATGVPSDGLVVKNSLYYQSVAGGYAVSNNVHTPYSQNWNVTISWQISSTNTLELSYQGNKGTHLFMPRENINPKDVGLLTAQNNAGVNTTATIADPLGRINPSNGRVLTVQNGSLGSPYLGFSSLTQLYDAAANSIRHATYVSFVHRARGGLTLNTNYTFGKSIDDASDAGSEKNVATVGRVDGQVALGGTRKGDRSVSLFDQTHVLNANAIYDLPFGQGKKFLAHANWIEQFAAGGWTLAPIFRLTSGVPATVTLGDANQLGDLTHTVRPSIAPGVPLVNPLYDRNCPLSSNCQPYLNPSAFIHPALGELGNAPRSLGSARGPWAKYFDLSVQKNWKIGERRRLQFRVDFLNAFNHPNFRVLPNSGGGTDVWTNTVSTAAISASEYDQWAAPNSQPLSTTPGGQAMLAQINSTMNSVKVNNVLPANFYTIQLPANFWGTSASSFDLRTVQGLKLFRLRNSNFNTGFGDLYNYGQPRYIQFGLKLYF
jgi:hypothetical protein